MTIRPNATATVTPRQRSCDAQHVLPRVIVAEVNPRLRRSIANALRKLHFDVVECRHGVELVEHLRQFSKSGDDRVDLIIADVQMPGVTGLSVLEAMCEETDGPPIILIAECDELDTCDEVRNLGAVAAFSRPFPVSDLVDAVCEILPTAAGT